MPESAPTLPSAVHESRLCLALRELLAGQRVASLGTLSEDGLPFVSMVPFALATAHKVLVVHISGLAAHTGNLQRQPLASLMVMRSEAADEPVHALPRVTLAVRAHTVSSSHPWHTECRKAYLTRFSEAEPMTDLPDFRFVALEMLGARQVAGFGAARSVGMEELERALGSPA